MKYQSNFIPVDITIKDGKKAVKFPTKWQDYQTKLFQGSFSGSNGRAVICGESSADLCGLDFDDHDRKGCLFSKFRDCMKPSLLEKLAIEKTPSNGIHVYFRFAGLTQKKVLAKREDGTATIELQASSKALLFCSPSPGYTKVQGSIEEAPVLTCDEFNTIISSALYLNEYVEQTEKKRENKQQSTSGVSPADYLRSNKGREWAEEVLEKNGFYPNGQKTSSNGFDFVTYSHPGASCLQDVHLGLYEDHVFLWSTNESKNCGLPEGAISFFDLIKALEFNNNIQELTKAFFNRFPELNENKNIVFVQEDEFNEEPEEEKEKEIVSIGGYTKDLILQKIKNDPQYSLLRKHIETTEKHSPKPLSYSYLLSGLSLIGLASYCNFYQRYDEEDNNERFPVDTGISFCVTAPPASGKESVKTSLTVYDRFLEMGEQSAKRNETGVSEFPEKSDRYIEKNCALGMKNTLYIKDEFQDVLSIKSGADSSTAKAFALAKKLITNKEEFYKVSGSSNFDDVCKQIEDNIGEGIDYRFWRLSLACFGTNNVFSSMQSGEEENGFCRRLLWDTEKQELSIASNPNTRSLHPIANKSFGQFLKALVNMRNNQGYNLESGSCRKARSKEPICSLRWSEEAVKRFQEVSLDKNRAILEGHFNKSVVYSYEDIVSRLAVVFAVSRAEWLLYNPYDLPEDLGGDAFGDSLVTFKEVTVEYDDVDLAIAVFLVSCEEYERGCAEFIRTSASEDGNKKLEDSILKFVKNQPSSPESVAKRLKKYSLATISKTLESLVKSGILIKNIKPSGKVIYTTKENKNEL